jgi:hypothetical protein
LQRKNARLGHWRQISKDEPVAFNTISKGESEWKIEHWGVKGETVKFPLLDTRVNLVGRRLQRIAVVFSSGESCRRRAWIDACNLSA